MRPCPCHEVHPIDPDLLAGARMVHSLSGYGEQQTLSSQMTVLGLISADVRHFRQVQSYVALEALRGDKAAQEIAVEHKVHPM